MTTTVAAAAVVTATAAVAAAIAAWHLTPKLDGTGDYDCGGDGGGRLAPPFLVGCGGHYKL